MKVRINHVLYNIEEYGQGEPIICLHGFTGNVETWYPFIPMLKDKYRMILIDIIGHGKTESPLDINLYFIHNVANDIKSIMDHLNIRHANILGYSMGGRLALAYSFLYPETVNKLILESSSPGLEKEEERTMRKVQDEKLATRILEKGIDSFIEYWTNIPLFNSQKYLSIQLQEEIRHQRLQNNPLGLANSLRGMGTGAQPSFWNKLNELKFPVLIMSGSLDEKFCRIGLEMKKRLHYVEHEIFMGIGHAIHVEDAQKFGTIIGEFLSK